MKDPQGQQGGRRVPWWEKTTVLLGLCLIAVLLGYLGWHAMGDKAAERSADRQEVETDPVVFDIERIEARNQGFLLHLKVRNQGPVILRGLHVEGQLYQDGQRLERSVGRLEALPPEGVRRVGLYFANDPRLHQLHLIAQNSPRADSQLSRASSLRIETTAP